MCLHTHIDTCTHDQRDVAGRVPLLCISPATGGLHSATCVEDPRVSEHRVAPRPLQRWVRYFTIPKGLLAESCRGNYYPGWGVACGLVTGPIRQKPRSFCIIATSPAVIHRTKQCLDLNLEVVSGSPALLVGVSTQLSESSALKWMHFLP